jgi:8-amino-7-oxononanoate synthase
MYKRELDAIKKSNRYRKRELFDEDLIDLASNDYLGMAENFDIFDKAVERVKKYRFHSPRASQLVNGYHPIHNEFEEYLCKINSFESGIVVGSGFLANISLIEALCRKRDLLILDEEYHASGILATKLVNSQIKYFRHNDPNHLKEILQESSYHRAIICVEGIYSMEADMLNRDIFDVVDSFKDTLLIVDEAHSGGVLGKSFLGVYEHYDISIKPNYIKMGTLGKAIGSYGAYILGAYEIIEFLQNRAKAIIYATAPSVFDTALSHESMIHIQNNSNSLSLVRENRVQLIYELFAIRMQGLILKLDIGSSNEVLRLKEFAKNRGFLIGAIRQPTVKSAILRIIPRLNIEQKVIKEFLTQIKGEIKN